MRLTPQREAVLDVVRASQDHPTAAEIYARVQERQPGVAFATVYNALRYFVRCGLVRELRFGDGASRYDARTEPHLHVVCVHCGAIAETEALVPAGVLDAVGRVTGYRIEGYAFFGVCPECARVHPVAANWQSG